MIRTLHFGGPADPSAADLRSRVITSIDVATLEITIKVPGTRRRPATDAERTQALEHARTRGFPV